jgi:phosphoribosylanthranilate isomerase
VLQEGPTDMWIKICGLTTPDAVAAALDAGADAIGFVFAKSVRQVSPSQALELAAPARGKVRCVAVTRHPTHQDIDPIIAIFKPDILQTDATDFELLKLPTQLVRLPVFRGTGAAAQSVLPQRILFEGATSGTGTLSDWALARKVARRTELVLAGGLNPGNVTAAIATVQPYGVDVSTGVESRPGVKSPAEIANFVSAARATRTEV